MILELDFAGGPSPWFVALYGASAAVLGYFIGVLCGYYMRRIDTSELERELAEERAFATRLLDDPRFFREQRAVIEATCDPATFGDFGRTSHQLLRSGINK